MRFDVLTIFPDFFKTPLASGLLAKGIARRILEIEAHNIRDYGSGPHKQVDDRPFGGGPGMVLRVDVLARSLGQTIKTTKKASGLKIKPHVILLDPAGTTLKQKKVEELAQKGWLVLVCGHYEGVDNRFKEHFVDEEISVGDYILSGGEVAALVMIDAISRLLPGFTGKKDSVISESFSEFKLSNKEVPLLDYPVYTRPKNFDGNVVPDVLLSGNHKEIKKWRLEKAVEETKIRRPDLLRQ